MDSYRFYSHALSSYGSSEFSEVSNFRTLSPFRSDPIEQDYYDYTLTDLPIDLLAKVLSTAWQTTSVEQRITCKAFRHVIDNRLIGKKDSMVSVSISGGRLSFLCTNHFAKSESIFTNLFSHMEKISSLRISDLQSVGPLLFVLSSPQICLGLTHLTITDCDRWLRAGNQSLLFHLRGIGSAANLVGLKITVKSKYYSSKKGVTGAQISSLARLLPLHIETLDLGGSLWSASSSGLVPIFTKLRRLSHLTLTRCPNLGSLSNLKSSHLRSLISLDLHSQSYTHQFNNLNGLSSLAHATNLTSLKLPRFISRNQSAQDMVDAAFSISGLTTLTLPIQSDSGDLAHLPFIIKCEGLRSLVLYGSPPKLDSLQCLSALSSLEMSVSITEGFEPLAALTSLVELKMSELYNDFTDLSSISMLKSLRSLDLSSIGDEVILDVLSSLGSLTSLSLYWEDSFPSSGVDLNAISALTKLSSLVINTIYPKDADVAPHLDALLINLSSFSSLKDLSIPLSLDHQAEYLSHLTTLTSLSIQSAFPNAEEEVEGEVVEIKAITILQAIASLPILCELRLEHLGSFRHDTNLSLGLLSAKEFFVSIERLFLESCSLSSAVLFDLKIGSTRLKKLSLEYCHGFSESAADALERDGLDLTIECDKFEAEEEDEEETSIWGDRFFALKDSMQAQIITHAALRSPTTSLEGPMPVQWGVLRLVCSHFKGVVDRSITAVSFDIPALIRSLPFKLHAEHEIDGEGADGLGEIFEGLMGELELGDIEVPDPKPPPIIPASSDEWWVNLNGMAVEHTEDEDLMPDMMPDLVQNSSTESSFLNYSPTSPVYAATASSIPGPLIASAIGSLMSRLKSVEKLSIIHPQLLDKSIFPQGDHREGLSLLDLLVSLDHSNGGHFLFRVEKLILWVPSLSKQELSRLIMPSATLHPFFTINRGQPVNSIARSFPSLRSLTIIPSQPEQKPLNLSPGCLEREESLQWMTLAINPKERHCLGSLKPLVEALAPLPFFESLSLSFMCEVSSLKPLTALKSLESLSLLSLNLEDAAYGVRHLTKLTRLCLRGLDPETSNMTRLLAPLIHLQKLDLQWTEPPGTSLPMMPMSFFLLSARLVADIFSRFPPLPELQSFELNNAFASSFDSFASLCPKISYLEFIDCPQMLSLQSLAASLGASLVKLVIISVRVDSIIDLKDCFVLESLVLSDVRQRKDLKPTESMDTLDEKDEEAAKIRQQIFRSVLPPCGNIVSDLSRYPPPKLKELTLSGISFFPFWSQEVVSRDRSLSSLMHIRHHAIISLIVRNPNIKILNLFGARGLTRKVLNLLCSFENEDQFIYYRPQDLIAPDPPKKQLLEQGDEEEAVAPPYIPDLNARRRPNGGRQLVLLDFFRTKIKKPDNATPRAVDEKKETLTLRQLRIDHFFSLV